MSEKHQAESLLSSRNQQLDEAVTETEKLREEAAELLLLSNTNSGEKDENEKSLLLSQLDEAQEKLVR